MTKNKPEHVSLRIARQLMLSLIFSFSFFLCQSAPEKIDKNKITNPVMQEELRTYEREIVRLNYDIIAQQKREEEFEQIYEEWQNKYKEASKEEQEKLKAQVELSRMKAEIEEGKRELLQLKLKERIAHVELKKATMLSAESTQPLELAPYESYHKSTASDVKSQEDDIRKLETKYNELLKENTNTPGGNL